MSENAKNLLQIRCQREKLMLPIYVTCRDGGSDHVPMWKSTVTINALSCEGVPSMTKIQAEISAAERFLAVFVEKKNDPSEARIERPELGRFNQEIISTNTHFKVPTPIEKDLRRTILLIDGENMHGFAAKLPDSILNSVTVHLYLGEHHALSSKESDHRIKKILCPGSRKDLVDTCITMHVAMFLTQKLYDRYWIASRDHFASTVVDLIGWSMIGETSASGKVVTQLTHCEL